LPHRRSNDERRIGALASFSGVSEFASILLFKLPGHGRIDSFEAFLLDEFALDLIVSAVFQVFDYISEPTGNDPWQNIPCGKHTAVKYPSFEWFSGDKKWKRHRF